MNNNEVLFHHMFDYREINIYGETSVRKTYSKDLVAIMIGKNINFFFGVDLNHKTSCQNYVSVYEDKEGNLQSCLNINIGTSSKPKFVAYDVPSIGLLSYFLK